MKKRLPALLLTAALLVTLLGCGAGQTHQNYTLDLYYRQVNPVLGEENGILMPEKREFGTQVPSFETIFKEYFAPPQNPELSSPFPKDLEALGTSLDGGVLTVTLSGQFGKLSGIGYSVAVAGLAKTLLQIKDVDAVCLEYEGADGVRKQTPLLAESDFVCRDLGAFNSETSVRLYFSDPNGRYLVAEERKNVFTDAALIPGYVVQQLLAGPTGDGLLGTMPEGTRLVELTTDDEGLCVVNLSSEFLFNKPTTELMERMCIYSLVNSLTELEPIKAVRLLVEGAPIEQYLYMDLSEPLHRDESAKSVVRAGLNEFDATLYVRSWSSAKLAAVPVSVRRMASGTQAQDLLLELLDFKGINGLTNPIPTGTGITSIDERGGVCYVDLSREFLQCAGKQTEELLAIHAVAATLCSIEGIHRVCISVLGRSDGLQYYDLTQPLIPNEKWFFE